MAGKSTYSKRMLDKAKAYVADPPAYGDVVPTAAGLSLELGVNRDTLYEWAKHHEAFSDTLRALQGKQERELVANGLTSVFNPTIAKLMLANHGYRDKQELTGKDGGAIETVSVTGMRIIKDEDGNPKP